MEEQQYAILFDVIADSVDYGLYLFRPISAIKGKYDEKEKVFVDGYGTELLGMENNELYFTTCEKAVGFVKTEKELREMYPEIESIEEIVSYYVDKISQERIEALYNFTDVKIREIPYDDIIMSIEGKEISSGKVTKSDIDDDEEPSLKIYEQYKKQVNNQEYSLFTLEELVSFIELDDINKIKARIENIRDNKFSYEAVIEKNKFENCYVIIDEKLKELLKLDNIENIKDELLKVINDKKNDDIDFQEQYKYNYGCFMLYDNLKDIRRHIKNELEECKQTLSNLDKPANKSDDSSLVKKFIKDEVEMLTSLLSMMSVSEIKEKYKNFYINQLKVAGKLNGSIKISQFDQSKNHVEKQKNYENFFKDKTVNEMINSVNEELNSLNKLVGLQNVKSEINSFIQLLKFNRKAKEYIKSIPLNLNMKFTGNAGTGKTTVANIISKLFYKLEYIKSDKVISCTAADLIAGYVGQTAIKTKELIDKYKGGVIFIDEAYVLSAPGQEFGPEAIVEIIKELEQNRTVFIFAGYTKEMESFIDSNSGIKSRIGVNIEFKDYSEEELCQMLINLFNDAGFILEDGLIDKFIEIFKTAKKSENFGNGRYVKETVFNSIIKEHAKNTENVYDIDALKTIKFADVPSNLTKDNSKTKIMGFAYSNN